MIQEPLVFVGIVLFAVVLASSVGQWSTRRPKRDRMNPEAIRLPKVLAVAGWLVAPVGLLLVLSAIAGTSDPEDRMPMLIIGILLLATAAFLVATYLNSYIVIRDDEIIQRTILRRLRTIRYDNIDKCRRLRNGPVPLLKLWGYDGVVIRFQASASDASPVLAALKRRQTPGA